MKIKLGHINNLDEISGITIYIDDLIVNGFFRFIFCAEIYVSCTETMYILSI